MAHSIRKICQLWFLSFNVFQGLPHCFTWWHLFPAGKYDGAVLRKRLKEGAGPHRSHDTGRVRVRVLTVTSNRDKAMGAAPESCNRCLQVMGWDCVRRLFCCCWGHYHPKKPQLSPTIPKSRRNTNKSEYIMKPNHALTGFMHKNQ